MDATAALDADAGPAMPVPDLLSMTRALGVVRDALDIPRDRARAAIGHRLVGGVLPDVSLAQLESLAAAGNARVRVVIETEDGRSLDLAQIV